MKATGLSASMQIVCYDAKSVDAGLLQSSRCKGSYLLKNGEISVRTVYNQEWGIFIDEHLYIPLKMTKQLLTAHEAEVYYRSMGEQMPDLYQIVRLKLAVEEVNSSLKKIGMQDFVFPEDILHNVWYEEALKDAKSGEMRRCIVISGYPNYQKPSYQQIGKDCLLFDDTIFYQRTKECYEPVSPVLKFNWSGIDFLCAEVAGTDYNFYRGKDLKLVYLGSGTKIDLVDNEVLVTARCLYQNLEGKLYEVCSLDDNASYSRCKDTGQIVITVPGEYILDGILECAWNDKTYFQKNENGLFVKVNTEVIDTYDRNRFLKNFNH